MKTMLRIEEGMMLVLAVALSLYLPFPPWLFWVLFLTPDIGLIGYAINSKTGALTYNLLHHKGIAILVYLSGIYFVNEPLQFAGLLLFGHSAFDRMLAYGLKYPDSFHNTHLGWIGKSAYGK
jgi:hypothetical protein